MSSIERAADRLTKLSAKTKQNKNGVLELPVSSESLARGGEETKRKHQLDLERMEREGFLTPGMGQTPLAEEYRAIKRPLLMNAFGKGTTLVKRGNLVMITSGLPGEGKTFTSVNLAMSISMELDATVLLVDADISKSAATKTLGLMDSPGLIDVLLDEQTTIGDVIQSTNVPKFSVIPAGRSHSYTTELLASDQMRCTVDELAGRYSDRIIVFDAPPLLVTSQASVLAHHVGQILFVVEAGKTPRHAVKAAVSQLGDDRVIGMVLNKRRRSSDGYYGGYYGSY